MSTKPKNGKVSQLTKRKVSPLKFKFIALDDKEYILTSKQKHWCDVYLEEGANQTIASLESYKIKDKHLCKTQWSLLNDKEKKRRIVAENVAACMGRDNYRKTQIAQYINKILSDEGYTDNVVRTEHYKNIKQDKNLPAKNQAIDMYYKTRGRYAPQEHIVKSVLTDEQLNRIIKD